MAMNLFGTRDVLTTQSGQKLYYYNLNKLQEQGFEITRLPVSIKVLLESVLREANDYDVRREDVTTVAGWKPVNEEVEIPFKPARVILQDFTGVPAVVDLAAMRSAMVKLGGDPSKINPLIPVDLVIDHSVQVDEFGTDFALANNMALEFERNRERYEFLRWGQQAFDNFGVVPPPAASCTRSTWSTSPRASRAARRRRRRRVPDSLVGTDSHTTMINGLGIVGWGVGGIEAEAVMLGQPIYMLMPEVIGFKITGAMPEGATATDLALRVTEMLRAKGVVGKFVEFYGAGLSNMTLPDRATIANMAPNTAPPWASSPWTTRRCVTCAAPAAWTPKSNWSRRTTRPRACTAPTRRSTPSSPTPSNSTWAPSSPASRAPSVPRTAWT